VETLVLKQPLAEDWQLKTAAGGWHNLSCLHPGTVRALIARVTLIGPGDEEVVVERRPQRRSRRFMARLEQGQPPPDHVRAELDLHEEFASLQSLRSLQKNPSSGRIFPSGGLISA